jgi:hypothetical protein
MKQILFLPILILLSLLSSFAQTTVTFTPNSATGKDALLVNRVTQSSVNYGNDPDYACWAWTQSGGNTTARSIMDFDFSTIPVGAVITNASLSLYCNTTSAYTQLQSGTNASYLERVTSTWDETTVTWNNQPTTSTAGRVSLASSTTSTQNYLNIDVTGLLTEILDNRTSSYGIMLKLQNESTFRCMVFGSSDHPDSTKRPVLSVTYTSPAVCENSVIIRPDAFTGKDALIDSKSNQVNNNFGADDNFASWSWTIGGNLTNVRSLIDFDLSSIPSNAIVNSAKLSLYCNTTSYVTQLNSGTNASYLSRITSPWDENTVTWNTQPTITTTNQVLLSTSSSASQNYLNIDIKNLIDDIRANPTSSYGLMLQLATETIYRSLILASSDHADSTKRPKLEICYSIPPSITLSNFNGGERILRNTTGMIYWNSQNATQHVRIDYSLNNGVTWGTIDTMAVDLGYYSWHLPDSVSAQCKIRVVSYEDSTLGDTSDAVFSIVDFPTYSITSPNGGEVWYNDEVKIITWTGTDRNNVKIQYSLNDTAWTNITANVSASASSYAWYPNGIASNHVRIRIIDNLYPIYGDSSNAVFILKSKPSFTFTNPMSISNRFCGDTISISWSSAATRLGKLEYSIEEGVWIELEDSILPSTTHFTYTPAGIHNKQIKFRLSDIDFPTIFKESNPLNIYEKPVIDLQAPIGGEVMFSGQSRNITWSALFSDSVNIYYSTNGVTWVTIATNINALNGIYPWTIPSIVSNMVQVKIVDSRFPQFLDTTVSVFSIRNAPQFSFTSPTPNEVWFSGESRTLSWTSSSSRYGRLEYAVDNGAWMILKDSILPNLFATTWVPFALHKSTVKFRLSDIDLPGVYTISEIVKVYEKPILEITSPNGGERMVKGSLATISWTAMYSDSIHIYYSLNGVTWVPFALNVNANAGNMQWNVPNTTSTSARLRIVDTRFVSYFDTTDATFAIINPPSVTLVSPNGGEEWLNNSTQNITWTSSDVNTLSIAYSVNNVDWNTIATGVSASTGSYSWILPAINNTTVKVRLTDEEFTNNIDTSNTTFSILTPPTLDLISPNGGELWYVDSTYTLSWLSTNINQVNLFYSINDSSWISIASNVSANSYDWQIPTTLVSDKLKVKVQNAGSFSVSDVSESNFETKVYLNSAVNETNLSSTEISLYPNPSTGTFIVNLPSTNHIFTLRVIDISGKVLFERKGISETTHTIDLGLIEAGIYFVELTNDLGIKTLKRIQIAK